MKRKICTDIDQSKKLTELKQEEKGDLEYYSDQKDKLSYLLTCVTYCCGCAYGSDDYDTAASTTTQLDYYRMVNFIKKKL